jgi:hypothetical protein
LITIFWGTKAVRDRLGFVADYCPVCRTMRAFSLQRHGEASHVQYISIPGEDRLVGYTRICMTCEGLFPAAPDPYSSLSPTLDEPEALRVRTFPDYHEEYAVQLALDRKMPSQLSPQDRHDRIHDPALSIAVAAEQRKGNMRMDRHAWLALAFLLSAFVVPGLLSHLPGVGEEKAARWTVSWMMLGFLVMFASLGTSGGRATVKWATAHLVHALAPLRPTDAELSALVEGLRQKRLWLGDRLKVRALRAAMDAPS